MNYEAIKKKHLEILWLEKRFLKIYHLYSHLLSYWILEGPRIAALTLNSLILLSVIRVLVTHLSCNEISDTNQIK